MTTQRSYPWGKQVAVTVLVMLAVIAVVLVLSIFNGEGLHGTVGDDFINGALHARGQQIVEDSG